MVCLEKDFPGPGKTPKIDARLIKRVVEVPTRQKPANATPLEHAHDGTGGRHQ